VFHVVVRHRSYRSAAAELTVSPQIKLLEDTLGVTLFERRGRAVKPNGQAILLQHVVQATFDGLSEGVRGVAGQPQPHQRERQPLLCDPRSWRGGPDLQGRPVAA
jgi:DNA-binding transcriptional LysR family regulator